MSGCGAGSPRGVWRLSQAQVTLAVAGLAVAGAAVMFSRISRSRTGVVAEVVASSSILVVGVVLVVAGVAGLVAVRRGSAVWYWWVVAVQLALAVLALTLSLSDATVSLDTLPEEVSQATADALRVAQGLVLAAVVPAALSGLSLIRCAAGSTARGGTRRAGPRSP